VSVSFEGVKEGETVRITFADRLAGSVTGVVASNEWVRDNASNYLFLYTGFHDCTGGTCRNFGCAFALPDVCMASIEVIK